MPPASATLRIPPDLQGPVVASFVYRHRGCVSERLSAGDFATRISAEEEWALIVIQAPTPERLRELIGDFQSFSRGRASIIAQTATSALFKATNPPDSIARAERATDCTPLLPRTYTNGLEHFDVVAPSVENVKRFADQLGLDGTVESVQVRAAVVEELSVLVRLADLTLDMTPKQLSTLLGAVRGGYYDAPRRTSTRDMAKEHGIGRSTLEEHLRKGEKHLLARLANVVKGYPFVSRVARRSVGRPRKR